MTDGLPVVQPVSPGLGCEVASAQASAPALAGPAGTLCRVAARDPARYWTAARVH